MSTRPSTSRTLILAVFVALISLVAGYSLWKVTELRKQASLTTLIVLPEPRAIPEFKLIDQQARNFGLEQLTGTWSLLFFGFTHCPDICPSTLYDLQRVNEEVRNVRGDEPAQHQVVFFSVDPERDTPEILRDYTAYFDPEFIAVTGDHSQLEPLTRKLGIAYRIEEHAEGESMYSVDHSASILLINPQGRLHGVFPAPHNAETMAADLMVVID